MDYPKSVPGVSLHNGQFTDGNPLLGIPASLDPAKWANDVTEEILNVIRAAGLIPTEGDSAQLLAAINAIVTDSLAPAATTDVAGVVELATAQELAAGTAGGLAVTPVILKPVLDGKQAAAVNLTALAGLAGAADRLPYFTGAGALSLATLTAAARTLLAATDAAGQRTAMGLGNAALATVMASLADATSGKLMPNGAWGVGGDAIETTTPDSLLPSGLYWVAAATTWSSSPVSGMAFKIVNVRFGNYALQIAQQWSSTPRLFWRSYDGPAMAGWGAWAEAFSTNNVSSFIKTLLDAADAASAQTTLNGFGYNQTWQDVTASRVANTTYTNSLGRPIMVNVFKTGGDANSLFVDELLVGAINGESNVGSCVSAIVPPGSTYRTNFAPQFWLELR
ncbi:hypothetical protein ACFOJE_19245 [Azotobacter bryophylli]|uniref:Phage tail protein n=1 Tax=Azotobacter bryophylli TaxID=1986537 RepID=A0ABV7AXM1_9GAMM